MRGRTTPQREVQRAQIILLAAEGLTNSEISKRVRLSRQIVGMWRHRFSVDRLAGLQDKPRKGRARTYTEEDRLRVITTVCNEKPEAETHWSIRTVAAKTGVSRETVHRILQAERLKPHLTRSWVWSNDPEFETKAVDIVGLYLNPPENTLVLSVDEKTSIQALDRTRPLLPLKPGQPERRSFDYKRNGTASLYAALAVHQGKVIRRGVFHSVKELIQAIMAFIEKYNRESKPFRWTYTMSNANSVTGH